MFVKVDNDKIRHKYMVTAYSVENNFVLGARIWGA